MLLTITAAAVIGRRRFPYFAVGWFWYVGMLVPVIGIVQFGTQSEADRFMYLPQIGLALAAASGRWGGIPAVARQPRRLRAGRGGRADALERRGLEASLRLAR